MLSNKVQKLISMIVIASMLASAAVMAVPAQVASAAQTAQLSPSANAADTGGDGNGFEVNPTGAYANGGGGSAFAENNNGVDDRHRYWNYGIPDLTGQTITGIEVRVDGRVDSTTGNSRYDIELSWDGGTSWTSSQTSDELGTGEATSTLGGPSNDWGRTWTASELSNANFRVRITSTCSSSGSCGSRDFELDWIPITVYYNTSPNTPTNTAPANGANLTTANPTFTWTAFSDPNGDTQSQFNVQLRQNPGSYSFREQTSTSTASTYTPTTWNLPDGNYCWHVRVRDNSNTSNDWSAYSAETCFSTDSNPPTSSATSPQYANAAFQVTANNATDGGTGVANVRLWFRGPTGNWAQTGATINAPGPYQWTFTPALGDGDYRFQSVACDNVTPTPNCEAIPTGGTGNGDSTTTYDASAPTSSATPPAGPINFGDISVPWTANGNVSGIATNGVQLFVKVPGSAVFVAGPTQSGTGGTFVYTPVDGDGTYCFYTIATDNATNVEAAPGGANGDGCTIYKTNATIGDRVWLDANGNGFQDVGETGINGVALTLQRGLTVIGTTTTSGGGAYSFTGLQGLQQQTVRDNFSSVSYSNNDGTLNWANNWIETGDNNNPASGNIQITSNQVRLNTSGSSLAREVNLSGYTSASFTFDYSTSGNMESDDTLVVEASNNGGGAYTVLETFADDSSGSRVYDLTPYIASNTRIRFRVSNSTTGSGEYFAFDNVQIAFQNVTLATYTVVVDSSNFNPGGPLNGLNATSDIASPYTVLVNIGEDVTSVDFGFGPFAIVGDLIYQDSDRNGVFNGGEPGIPNITVWLYSDGNANGKIDGSDAIIKTTSSNANGIYALRGVSPGSYTVLADVNDPDLPGGFRPTSPNPIAVPGITGSPIYDAADIGFNTPPPVTKELYLRTPTDLTRNRPTGFTHSSVQILSSDTIHDHSVNWLMPVSQALAGPVTFVNGQAVQAILRIQSQPSASALTCGGQLPDVTVTLSTVGGPTLATATINNMPAGLNTRIFNLNLPAGTTLPANSRLQLKIDASGADCGLNPPQDEDADGFIVVNFDSVSELSRLEMPVVSYINITQGGTFDAAFPAGAPTPTFIQGDTVFFRVTASDPFGAFDVSGANISVPGYLTNTAMSTVSSGPLTKTLQSSLGGLLGGNYSYTITATEGLENSVSATITGTFNVIVSNMGNSSKTVDKAIAAPGDILTYTITLSNSGLLNANVRMTDTLPANVTHLNGPTGGGSYNAGLNAVLFNGIVPANGQVVIVHSVRVNTPLDNGTVIANNVTIDDGFSRFDTSPPATTVIQSAPNLSTSTKSVDRATAAPGDTLVYTIILTNTGNMNAQIVEGNPLLDNIPANTAFDGGLFASAGTISFNPGFNRVEWYGTVPTGGNIILRFRVKLATPLDNGTIISNTAQINEGIGFPGPQIYPRTATTTVVSAPNLVAQSAKVVDKAIAAPGDVLAYTIVLKNSGNMNAPNVTLTDTLPANTTWGGDIFMASTSGLVQFFPITNTLVWQGDMNAGATVQIIFRANLNTPLPNNTLITNIARVSDAPGNFTPFQIQALTSIVSSPNLSTSTKTVNAATATPGSILTYTLTLINSGNAVATTFLTDTLPAELQNPVLISASSGTASVVGNQVRWNGVVTPGQNIIITFRATLLPVLNNGTQVANTAQIRDGVNPLFFISPSAITTIQSTPDLNTSIKRVNLATAAPGDQLVYTIFLTNTGNMAADTVVRDVLPPNVTFNGGLSASAGSPLPTYSAINNRVNWQGLVVPGTTITVSYRVVINTPLDNGLVILNDAEINDSVHTPFDTNPPAQTTIVAAPDLSTSNKTVDLVTAAPGDLLHYTVHLVNTGNMVATGVSLSDTIPTQVTFASGPFVTGGGSGGWNPAQRRVFWNGSVAPGADVVVEYFVNVNNPLPNGTLIINDAQVLGSFPTVTTNAVTTTVFSDHVLTLSKTAPSVVAAGSNLTYTLSWSVTGNEPATNVVITDAIPANTTFSSCTAACTFAGGVATWNLGNRVPGNSGSVQLVVVVSNLLPNGTIISNTARIFDNENAPVLSSATTTVSSGHGFSLNKHDTGFDPVQAGAALRYTIDWSTSGTEAATGVVITDGVPLSTTYGACSPAPCSQAAGIVTWNLGNQNPNTSGTVLMTVTVNSPQPNGTIINNLARISDSNGGLPTTDTEQTTVNSAHTLDVEKSAPTTIAAGAQLAYTIFYTVTGNETALNLIIDDTTPLNTTFSSASGAPTIDSPGVGNSGLVRWHLGNVTPGTTGSVTLIVTVNSPLANGTVINNSASISDGNGGVSDVDAASTTVGSSHGFLLTKIDTPDPTTPNGFINYTIHWEVTGNETAQSVVITDSIPANTTFSNCGACVLQAGFVRWDLGNRAPGSNGDVFVQVRVDTPLPNGTLISNVARVSDSNGATPLLASTSTTINSDHQLALSKSAPSVVSAGSALTYTLNWSVTGDEPAPTVVITDAIPANTTFSSCTGGCTVAGGVATWNLGNLVPGNSGSLTLIVNVNNLLPNGTVIANTARIRDADNGAAFATANTTISSGHGFSLDKRDTGFDPVAAGATLIYSIDWSTAGTEAATGVIITDAVPLNTTYVSCNPAPCSQAAGVVTWNLGNQNPNASGTVQMNVTVASPLPNLTLLTNSARISDNNGGLPTSDLEQTTVNSSHTLQVDKTAPATTTSGGQIAYTIFYTVTGTETAQNVIIDDNTPTNTTFASAAGAPTINAPAVGSAGLVRWHLGNLTPGTTGSVQLVVNVNSPLANGTVINNSVSIADSNGGTTDTGSASTTVTSGHGFQLSKTDTPDPVTPNGFINYTIHWEVTGNEPATNVVITDAIPVNTTFSNCGACVLQAGFVSWDLGNRTPGSAGDVFVQVRVNTPLPNGTVINNFSRVSDSNGGTAAIATATTTVNSDHQLALTKSAPSIVSAGSALTYTLNWSVTGDEPAPTVVITDAIPANTTFSSCTGGCTVAGGIATWNLGNLVPGNSGSLTLIVTVDNLLPNGTVIANTARIRDADNGAAFTTANSTVSSGHGFSLDKRDTGYDPVQAGAALQYSIDWSTAGTEAAQSVIITDAVPANTTYGACSPAPCNQAGGVVTWTLGNRNPNTSGTVFMTVTVNSPLPNLTLLTNQARISDSNGGLPTSDLEQTTVNSSHALDVNKTAAATVASGAQLTYNIAWAVTGNETAQNLVIEDITPPNTTFVSASGAPTIDAPAIGASGLVRWRLGNQPPGASGTVTLVVSVNTPLPNGTQINNTASISDGNGGTTDSDPADTTVTSGHALSLTKFDTPDPVTPGGILNYTLHWEVSGNELAQNIIITDGIPANTTFWSCGGCALQGGNVRWNLGLHFPGDNGDVTLQVLVATPLPNGTQITNTAEIADSNGGTPDQDTVTTTVSSDHNLTINKTGPTAAPSGGQIAYTIDYQVSGTEIAPSVFITDAVPLSTTYVINSCTPAAICSEAGGVVTWDLGDLPPGSAGTVEFTVRADTNLPNGTIIVNTAYIFDGEGKLASDGANTRIGSEANLALLDNVANVQPGDIVTYTASYNGSEPLNNGRVQIDVPPYSTLIGGSTGMINAGDAAFWLLAPQPPGFSGQRYLVVMLDPILDNGTLISTTAYLSGDGQNTNATAEATVISAPNWSTALKSTDRGSVQPSSRLTYTLMLSNTGNMHGHGIAVQDPLPAAVTYVNGSVTASSGVASYDAGTRRILWNGEVPVGSPVKIVFVVTINAGVAPGTTIINTATLNDEINPSKSLSAEVNTVANEPRLFTLYMPIITRNTGAPELPDLTVTSFLIVPNPIGVGVPGWDVQVTVKNIGNAALPNGVWVDLYIDPISVPTPNTPFYEISPGPYGGVWWIPQLNPGESVVLSKDDILPDWLLFFPNTFNTPGLHTLYVQVDSLDERTATPPVWARAYELNESNNISMATVTVNGLGVATFVTPPQALPPLPERRSPQ